MADQPARPTTGDQPGWPRPRLACTADALGEQGERRSRRPPHRNRPAARPVPWVSELGRTAWDPWEFSEPRTREMRARDLCQCCGQPRLAEVFVIERMGRTIEMYGGALCSLRCARLVAAVCPHYREVHPVTIWRVPKRARVDILGCGEDNDDEYELDAGVVVSVVGDDPHTMVGAEPSDPDVEH